MRFAACLIVIVNRKSTCTYSLKLGRRYSRPMRGQNGPVLRSSMIRETKRSALKKLCPKRTGKSRNRHTVGIIGPIQKSSIVLKINWRPWKRVWLFMASIFSMTVVIKILTICSSFHRVCSRSSVPGGTGKRFVDCGGNRVFAGNLY